MPIFALGSKALLCVTRCAVTVPLLRQLQSQQMLSQQVPRRQTHRVGTQVQGKGIRPVQMLDRQLPVCVCSKPCFAVRARFVIVAGAVVVVEHEAALGTRIHADGDVLRDVPCIFDRLFMDRDDAAGPDKTGIRLKGARASIYCPPSMRAPL